MHLLLLISAVLISTTSLTITEPMDGETYSGDWLPLKAIVENENTVPDSVHYTLNGGADVLIPRLNTDWYTYMANDLHTGFSESPGPMDSTIFWSAPVTGTEHEFPTPVVVNGIVYYPQDSTGDSLYALDAVTGDVIWKYWTGYTDDAVTVKDGLLYTSSDSLWCLNALTGARVWANGDATSAASTPAVDESYVYNCNPSFSGTPLTDVYCLDRFTGNVEWMVTVQGYAASCLTVWNGMLLMPTWLGPLYALDLDDGSVIWQNTDSDGGYWDSSPVIVEDVLYILGNDSYARAVNPSNGVELWSTAITPGTYLSATPAYYDQRLFFGDQVDSFYSMNCSNGSFDWTVPGVIHGSPGVADDVVYFGEGSNYYDITARVFAYSCQDGSVLWSYTTDCGPYGIVSSPSITDGIMYIAATDGNLYAFGTGLKYTYREDFFYAELGANELIVTSFDEGSAVAADTVSFTVTGTGIGPGPYAGLRLAVSPNPFRSVAVISFQLDSPGPTAVAVYDVNGRVVRTLMDMELGTGTQTITWDGTGDGGAPLSSGLYYCLIRSGAVSQTTGICLLK